MKTSNLTRHIVCRDADHAAQGHTRAEYAACGALAGLGMAFCLVMALLHVTPEDFGAALLASAYFIGEAISGIWAAIISIFTL